MVKKKLTTEKLGLHIFELRLGARETGGLSMLPRGSKMVSGRVCPTRL
jgi:hypothetical protein